MRTWELTVETVEGPITGIVFADSRKSAIRLSEQLDVGRGIRVLRRTAKEIFG